jgi:TrmH family RNA methyltransferase
LRVRENGEKEQDMNQQQKEIITLQRKASERRKTGLFVVEGVRAYREVPPERIEQTVISESFSRQKKSRELTGQQRCTVVPDGIFAALSDTRTPQGILAVVRQIPWKREDLFPAGKKPLLMILETLQDPGNLGTIFRAGEAAGITGIVMNAETCDPWSPKAVRSTMGSIFRVPFLTVPDLKAETDELRKAGVRVCAADMDGELDYTRADYTGGTAFLIGNEGNGLSEQALRMADTRVRIPMCGRVESLNAAVASSVLMFEAARQRRTQD